jgi:hypothetical protein
VALLFSGTTTHNQEISQAAVEKLFWDIRNFPTKYILFTLALDNKKQFTVNDFWIIFIWAQVKVKRARCWWLIPIILVTQEAEIRSITVRSQPWQIVCNTLSQKYPTCKKKGR